MLVYQRAHYFQTMAFQLSASKTVSLKDGLTKTVQEVQVLLVALLRPRVRLLRHSVHQGYTNFPFKNIPYTGLQPTNFQPSGIELVEET